MGIKVQDLSQKTGFASSLSGLNMTEPLTHEQFEKEMGELYKILNKYNNATQEHLNLIEENQLQSILGIVREIILRVKRIEATMDNYQNDMSQLGAEVSDLKTIIEQAVQSQ